MNYRHAAYAFSVLTLIGCATDDLEGEGDQADQAARATAGRFIIRTEPLRDTCGNTLFVQDVGAADLKVNADGSEFSFLHDGTTRCKLDGDSYKCTQPE